MALLAKAHQKPFYALAESYKFLRHFPLSQTDLPNPRSAVLNGKAVLPLTFDTTTRPNGHLKPDQTESPPPGTPLSQSQGTGRGKIREVTQEMLDINPEVDVTMPGLIDYIITDLGSPLSPTSVSQYIVAQFAT